MTDVTEAVVWHSDGHAISLELNRSNVVITEVDCPQGECQHTVYGCMVKWFLDRFGLECNVGVAPIDRKMTIAWMLSGDSYDLESAQIWIIPTTDDAFAAWMITQQ